MNSIIQKQERYNRRSAYEILIMRSWKGQWTKGNDPSVSTYEALQNSLEGLNFTGKSTGGIFWALKADMIAALNRLSNLVRSNDKKIILADLSCFVSEAVFIEQIDEIVETALGATQELVR